jgi:hypothetical protein
MRFIFFFPVGETDRTTSTLFPQKLQRFTLFFDSALAATSVFDFPFSAICYLLSSSKYFSHQVKQFKFPLQSPGTQFAIKLSFTGFVHPVQVKAQQETSQNF